MRLQIQMMVAVANKQKQMIPIAVVSTTAPMDPGWTASKVLKEWSDKLDDCTLELAVMVAKNKPTQEPGVEQQEIALEALLDLYHKLSGKNLSLQKMTRKSDGPNQTVEIKFYDQSKEK